MTVPPLAATSPGGKLQWLQVARAVAALLVVLFHLRPHWQADPVLAGVADGFGYGFAGVDVFFVLSGFVVARSIHGLHLRSPAMLDFLLRRAARIFLGYWPVFALSLGLYIGWYGWAPPSAGKFFGSLFLLFPSMYDHWLAVAWTLTFELYFYALMALGALFCVTGRHRYYGGVLLMLAVWNSYWWVLGRDTVYAGAQPLGFPLNALGMEFFAGALLAELDRRMPQADWRGLWPVWLALAVLGLAIGASDGVFNTVSLLRVGSYGLFGLALCALFLGLERSGRRAPATAVTIGDASYSLYLLHPLLIDLIAGSLHGWLASRAPSLATATLVVAPLMFVAVAIAWYRWIERPLYRRVTAWLKRPRHAAAETACSP